MLPPETSGQVRPTPKVTPPAPAQQSLEGQCAKLPQCHGLRRLSVIRTTPSDRADSAPHRSLF
jgi:hypothetical protein